MSSVIINAPEVHSLYPQAEVSTKNNYETVIKTGLWFLGTIVFCLAMIDLYAQTFASETQIGLQSAKIEKLKLNRDLRFSDINPLIVGSPTIHTQPADKYKHICKSMKQYTWNGFFKSYSVTVYIGLGEDPSIDFIH